MNYKSDSTNGSASADYSAVRAQLISTLAVTERRLDLAGIPTAVLERGEGSPVVLLHGQGEFAATWMRVIPRLAENHRVIAVDLPGHGASGVGDGVLDAQRLVAWMHELVDKTCSSPPILMGHLLGGSIAARYATRRSDRLAHLVLVDAMGLAPYRPAPRFALAMVTFVALPNENTRDRVFRQCFVDLDGLRREVGDPWTLMSAYALERARSPELKAALRSLMPKLGLPRIPSEDLERISVPTTMIWGRHDLQVRLKVAEAANARYGWPLHVIEGAADDPAVEQPEAFMKAVQGVLADDAGAPPVRGALAVPATR